MVSSSSGLKLGLSLGSSPAYEPEALALFDRMTVPPNTARMGHINALIAGLKQAGVWQRFDAFYMLAAHDAQAARLNWVADAYNLTAVNNPAFEVDRGYTGNGVNAYLDTGFNPVTANGKFSLNDAHMGVWCLTDAAEDRNDIGNLNARIFARNSGGAISGRMNDTAAPSPIPPTATAMGHTLFSRVAASGYRIDRNGIEQSMTSNISTGMSDSNFWVLSANGGLVATKQLSAAHAGGSMPTDRSIIFYDVCRTYLTAVGVL